MRVSEAFPSKYLKAADLQGKNVLAVMDYVQTEKLGDDERPVLYFKGKEKGLVLNRTNAEAITKLYGDEMNDWNGEEIVMFEAMVSFKKETVPAIRVRAPARNMRQAPQRKATNGQARQQQTKAPDVEWEETAPKTAPAQAKQNDDMDDTIPF